MIFAIHRGLSPDGPMIGTIEATAPYDAAVQASRRFFKVDRLPKRMSGWAPHESGQFITVPREGAAESFYVRRP